MNRRWYKIRGKMDTECVRLCKAMNLIHGIHTFESCCGHGNSEYHIWFVADTLKALPNLLYWLDCCHSGCTGWRVIAQTDCGRSPVTFMVEGTVGEQAYREADEMAALIEKDNKK